MMVDLTDEQEALIRDIAHHDGKSPAEVLTETAVWLQMLAEDEEESRIIEDRIAEANRGEFWISHEEMKLCVQKMLQR